jgi:hypothetical protein
VRIPPGEGGRRYNSDRDEYAEGPELAAYLQAPLEPPPRGLHGHYMRFLFLENNYPRGI